jgi:hypothetical protein
LRTDGLAEFAGEKLGLYYLLTTMEKIEIRAQTGRIEYKKEFEFVNPIWLMSLPFYTLKGVSLYELTSKQVRIHH